MEQNYTMLNVSNDPSLGRVEIAPEVIEIITGLAASEVKGISSMQGNFAAGVVEKFGKKSHSKGVKVELTDDGVFIDLFIIIQFGVSIPKVAKELQAKVRQTLRTMTALDVEEINVHVVDIAIQTNESVEK